MTFKEKLIILRKARGLTQDDFASAVGVSRQAVYKWESGQSYPEVPKLLEIKTLLNISIDELLDDNFDIPVPEKKKRKRTPKAAPTPKAQPAPTPAPKAEPVKPTPVAQPAPAPAPKAEPVKPTPVAQPAPAPAPKAEPEVKPEPKIDSVPAPTEIDFDDLKESDENTKKVGFFGRLFGKK